MTDLNLYATEKYFNHVYNLFRFMKVEGDEADLLGLLKIHRDMVIYGITKSELADKEKVYALLSWRFPMFWIILNGRRAHDDAEKHIEMILNNDLLYGVLEPLVKNAIELLGLSIDSSDFLVHCDPSIFDF